jgi:hypothetical protein
VVLEHSQLIWLADVRSTLIGSPKFTYIARTSVQSGGRVRRQVTPLNFPSQQERRGRQSGRLRKSVLAIERLIGRFKV